MNSYMPGLLRIKMPVHIVTKSHGCISGSLVLHLDRHRVLQNKRENLMQDPALHRG